ncbi:unnamed protein product [Parascedosporium putredinis]|uniref:Major facilitator superfamily (MFS) profile domain-containing protein n=1 Tax=Parascedosporium putredinis TaxID=1442378 RepID=A0A9P1MES9_9PEZI|nr:unnamed protein product [Parascedosporium putredinis]CAI8002103.1 unnamed protein product [Parascedosporium putredinis]
MYTHTPTIANIDSSRPDPQEADVLPSSTMAIAMGWKKPDNVAGTAAPAIMVGLFVASGGLLFGYDTGSINGILDMRPFKDQFSTGRPEAAGLSLSRLRRLDITHPALIDELQEIVANHEYELTLGPDTYMDVIRGSPHLGRRTLTGCVLQMLQQLTGINFIMYYSTTFFKGAGVDDPYTKSVIINVINVVSTFPGLLVIESWGRRKLLIVGAIGMAVCQLLIASFTTAAGDGDELQKIGQTILIVFCAIYIFFFAASWGPVAWVVTSEIYPLKVRAKAMSISTASNWLLNFAIAYGIPFMHSIVKLKYDNDRAAACCFTN